MSESGGTTAIVVGAGMAGLVAARVLSEHVDRVTVLERDRLPEAAVTRRSVPQGRHAHVLPGTGRRLLDGWFPGLTADLEAGGAVPVDARDLAWHPPGDRRGPLDPGSPAMSMSRPLLEGTIRRALLRQRPNVAVVDDTAVDGLVVTDGRVIGVRVDADQHRADLVVACPGRHTHFLDQLAGAGFPPPEMSAIRIDLAYASRIVPRRPGDLHGALAVVADDPALGRRVGLMVPVEGDRWIITLGSFHGEAPPTDPAGYQDFARSLAAPALSDVLARSDARTPVLTHRMPTSQRRHLERLGRTPPGFLVLGDALCSLNPFHWQGTSSAAAQAQALDRAMARHGPASTALARAFYRRAAAVVDPAWTIAARTDVAPPARAPGSLGQEGVEVGQELGPGRLGLGEQVVAAVEQHEPAVRDQRGQLGSL